MSSDAPVAVLPEETVNQVPFDDKYSIRFNSFPVSGAYGVVTQVVLKSDSHGKVYASKMIAIHPTGLDERQKQEINVLRTMSHPFLVKFYEYLLDIKNNYLYIITEWCESGSLRNVMIKHKHQPQTYFPDFCSKIPRIFSQIALGLSALHDAAIAHRDLKPDNVLITSGCIVKICDHGLVKVLNVNESVTGTAKAGTTLYMAPQQIRCLESLEGGYYPPREGDIWSLGCILYEMATLRIAFASPEKILAGKYVLKDTDNITPPMADLISNMLQDDERSRFTIDQVLDHEFTRETVEQLGKDNHLFPLEELNMGVYQPHVNDAPQNIGNFSHLRPVMPISYGFYPAIDLSMNLHDNNWTSQQWGEMVEGRTLHLAIPPIQLPKHRPLCGAVLCLELRRHFSKRFNGLRMSLDVGARILSDTRTIVVDDLRNLYFNCSIVIEATTRGDETMAPESYYLKRRGNVFVKEGADVSPWFRFDPVAWDKLDGKKPPKIYLCVGEQIQYE